MTANNREAGDSDLRDRFAALRREEEAQAPPYAVLSAGVAGRRRSFGKLIAVAACLVTIAAVVLWLRPVPPKPERPGKPVASLMEWRAPTDFLLETPGRELLSTVPTIGVWHNDTQAPRPGQKHPQVRKQVLP